MLCCLVYKRSIGEFSYLVVAWRATNLTDLSGIKQSDLRAVLFQELEQILGFEPYGGGIVIGVYTDQAGALQKGPVQPEGDLVLPVVEQAQGRHRARDQPQHVHQILIRDKGQRPGVVLLPEGFQVGPFVSLDRNEIVIALFVVPDEEIFSVGFRVGQVDLRHLSHIENGFVLRYLMPDVSGSEESIDFLFVHVTAFLCSVGEQKMAFTRDIVPEKPFPFFDTVQGFVC